MSKLKCESCGNYHYQWFIPFFNKKSHQTIGCASVFYFNQKDNTYEITSHYGSVHDLSKFKVSRTLFPKKKLFAINKLIGKSSLQNEVLICDNCIDRFIKRKYIILTNSNFLY